MIRATLRTLTARRGSFRGGALVVLAGVLLVIVVLVVVRERPDAAREAALTLAAISYASALANGQVDPRRIWKIYSVQMPKVDVEAGLAATIDWYRANESWWAPAKDGVEAFYASKGQ